MAYRSYTSTEMTEIGDAMHNAAIVIKDVATQMDTEGLSPAEFPFGKWLTAYALDKIASDAMIQMKELIRQKRTGHEATYLRNKRKNDRKAALALESALAEARADRIAKGIEPKKPVRKAKK